MENYLDIDTGVVTPDNYRPENRGHHTALSNKKQKTTPSLRNFVSRLKTLVSVIATNKQNSNTKDVNPIQ